MTNDTEEHVTKVVDDKEYIQDVRNFFKGFLEMKRHPMWFIQGMKEIPFVQGFDPTFLPNEVNGYPEEDLCAVPKDMP